MLKLLSKPAQDSHWRLLSLGRAQELEYWSPSSSISLQWGTAYTEIKVPSVENPELQQVLPLKPATGQKMAISASPTARNFFILGWPSLLHVVHLLTDGA